VLPTVQVDLSYSGDSYTSTSFNPYGEQPSRSNPLGNPVYPGATSSDGPNYVDFLTTTYNRSFVEAYNFGFGGATINYTIVPDAFGTIVQSFADQVQKEFVPIYGNNSNVPWRYSNSLFTIFFGINDCGTSYVTGNGNVISELIQSYQNIVDKVRFNSFIPISGLTYLIVVYCWGTQLCFCERSPHRSLAWDNWTRPVISSCRSRLHCNFQCPASRACLQYGLSTPRYHVFPLRRQFSVR